MSKAITYLLAAPSVFLWLVAAVCANAFAVKTLWAWFAVPAFGLAEISMPMAIGLTVLTRQIVGTGCAFCKKEEDKKYHQLLYPFAASALSLLTGWIALQFI